MGSSAPATTTQNTHTTAEPWGPAQGAFLQLLSNAQQAYKDNPTTPRYSGPNEYQVGAVDYMAGAAQRAQQGVQDVRNLGQATVRGDFLSPDSNPYLRGAVDAAQRPLREQLDQNILGVQDAAQKSGAYGGSRDQIMRGQALSAFNEDALDTASKMYNANYQSERDRQMQGGNLLNQANVLDSQPGLILDQIGSQVDTWDQRLWDAEQEAPWLGMDRLGSVLGMVSPYGSSSGAASGTAVGARPSPGVSALTGAASGASIGSSWGPWGALIGAGVGALGGYATAG